MKEVVLQPMMCQLVHVNVLRRVLYHQQQQPAVIAIPVGLLLLLLIYFIFYKNTKENKKKKKNNKKLKPPPFSKAGYVHTVKAIVSKQLPYHLLQWAKNEDLHGELLTSSSKGRKETDHDGDNTNNDNNNNNNNNNDEDYSTIFQLKVPFAPFPMVVATGDPTFCRQVLNDKTSIKTKGGFKVFKEKVMNSNCDDILSAEGMFWKHSRKNIAPAFSSNHIKRMTAVVNMKINELITNKLDLLANHDDDTSRNQKKQVGFEETRNKESFDVGVEMIHLTLSVISETAFEYHMTIDEKNMFTEELSCVLAEARKGKMPLRWKLGKAFIPQVQKAHQAGVKLLAFGLKILEKYRKLESPIKGTVVDLIAKNDQYENDEERANDILVTLVAGHDTTAYTLAWTFLELAKNKVEQTKLRNELRSLSLENRKSSVALDCVIKESQRLRTVTPIGSPRVMTHDAVVHKSEKNGLKEDIFVPKGSAVMCSQILLNRNPKYYDDPDAFKPSRWIDPSDDALASFMPFSLGRRNCVGQSLAKAEIVNVLSSLCSRYEFSVDDEGAEDLSITHQTLGTRLFVSKVE
jgi:cytochrome P450